MFEDSPIQIDRGILGGTPCFRGTRVPIQNLIDHVKHNRPLDEFFVDFPSVTREQVAAVLDIFANNLYRYALVTA
ncbi:MAG TPA: DUF433 domain-containing protein [Tepidisphaeraceae bacterium]|jgi:uncharacterized protein (DUF433 family)